MPKIDSYIDSWLIENESILEKLASPKFDEKYQAKEIFGKRLKELIESILETLK